MEVFANISRDGRQSLNMFGTPLPVEPSSAIRQSTADRPSRLAWLSVLLAFLLSALPITSSLWLDETATYWVVKDRIPDVFMRSWEWSGQSALYYLMAWASRHLAPYLGLEPALRLPSFVAMLLTAALLYRLGRYLIGPRAGAFTALAFLCIPDVSFVAIDARPYALGLALVVASMLCFVKWLDEGRTRFAVLYAIASALVVYAHYLFALTLAAQLIYGWPRIRKLAVPWIAIGILCMPLGGQVLHFYHARRSHSFAVTPGIESLFTAIAPPVLAAVVLLSLILSRHTAPPDSRFPHRLIALWLLLPPAFLFVFSLATPTQLFVSRYYLDCAPAAALLAGYVIDRFSARRTASILLIVALGLAVWQARPLHGKQDWRGAMQFVKAQLSPDDVLLVTSGFVEGTPEAIHDPGLREVLYAPQLAYPIEHMIRLPYGFDQTAIPADLTRYRRVFLVTVQTTLVALQASVQYNDRVQQNLPGYTAHPAGFGSISVVRFDK